MKAIVAGFGVMAFSAATLARQAEPDAAGSTPTTSIPQPPILSGPRVDEGERPEAERFVESKVGEARVVPEAVRRRAFLRALGTLRDSEDPKLKPSDEQRAAFVRVLARARAAASQPQRQPQNRGSGATDKAANMTDSEPSKNPLRPEPESWDDLQAQAWALLTEPQRQAMTAELERIRIEYESRRDDEYLDRQRREIQGQMDERRDKQAEIPTGRGRLREYLDRLPPERREQVARRLRERAARTSEGKTGKTP